MNFIQHYKGWLRRVTDDERLTPHHVSLYLALLETWNINRFRNPVTIYRGEVMRISKIGSKTTYLKCLHELSEWQYIDYKPSFNPQQGSRVYLYTFGTTGETGAAIAPGTATGTTPGPIYKTIQNHENIKNAYDTSHDRPDFFNSGDTDQKRTDRGRAGQQNIPGSIGEAQAYFVEIQSTAAEAEKFFNYFQSNGWRVGGRASMQDWRASARNWVINAKKFIHEHATTPKPGKLYNGPKNYSEPL